MLNILKNAAIAFSTSLVSLSAVVFPANLAQSATFEFTIDGIEGRGELSFDDTSLTGADLEVVQGADLIDSSFNFEFLIEGELISVLLFDSGESIVEVEPITGFIGNFFEPSANLCYSGSDFGPEYQEASFIFEKGTLTGITNYDYCYDMQFPREGSESVFISIMNSMASFEYESSASPPNDCYFDNSGLLVCLITRTRILSATDLPLNFSTVVAWQDPNAVPEPSIILGLGLLALGLRKIKKS